MMLPWRYTVYSRYSTPNDLGVVCLSMRVHSDLPHGLSKMILQTWGSLSICWNAEGGLKLEPLMKTLWCPTEAIIWLKSTSNYSNFPAPLSQYSMPNLEEKYRLCFTHSAFYIYFYQIKTTTSKIINRLS